MNERAEGVLIDPDAVTDQHRAARPRPARFRPWLAILLLLRRMLTFRPQEEVAAPALPVAAVPLDETTTRLDRIAAWIGTPVGRGRIVGREPEMGARREFRVWTAAGELTTTAVTINRRLGAGLAGTVYEVTDDTGHTYVEKHYGAIPFATGKLGRWLTALVFSFFRQGPLSFRELPASVVVMHLANRFVVRASTERFGAPITPPLRYTRYDEVTGGYVQGFEFVEGRPLRPCGPGLPLFGEAAAVLPTMRMWRDFLMRDLGLWGLARQVDPTNLNSFSNIWITPDDHVVLLDIVPGVPGFLEPRYLWCGLRHGQFAPFADAVHLRRLAAWVDTQDDLDDDFALFRVALRRWQDSEPRLPSSPARPLRVLTDRTIKASTRESLLTHLEVKGAIDTPTAESYREQLHTTGRFPKVVRHSLLKMAPRKVHLAFTRRGYFLRALRHLPRLVGRFVRAVGRVVVRFGKQIAAVVGAAVRHIASRELRMRTFRERMSGWVEEEYRLGRLSDDEVARLRSDVHDDDETADLAGLFVVHLSISALKHSLLGPSAVWIGLAFATENWWFVIPALVAPTLRVATVVAMGFGRKPGLIVFSAVPDVGVLAAPMYLTRRRPHLGTFIVRVFAQKIAMAIPAFGARGGAVEMIAVAAVQVLISGPFRVLPWAFLTCFTAVVVESWPLLFAGILLYGIAVIYALIRPPEGRGIARGYRAGAAKDLKLGLPAG